MTSPDTVLAVLLGLSVKATTLLAAAIGLAAAMRHASAGSRYQVWMAAFASVLLLPLAAIALPVVRLRVLNPTVELASSTAIPIESAAPSPFPVVATRGPAANAAVGHIVPYAEYSWSWSGAVVGVWLVGSFVLLLRQQLGLRAVGQLVRSCRPAMGDLDARVTETAHRLGIGRRVVVRVCGDPVIPMTCGILSPAIVLPETTSTWSDGRLDAVLAHELAHCARFDTVTDQVAQLATYALWWHPLAWLALRRARLDRECACDDLVLAGGRLASDYADDLVAVVETLTAPAVKALAVGRRSHLEHRIRAILDVAVDRRRGSKTSLCAGVVLVAAAVGVATTHLAARRATIAGPQAPETSLTTAAPMVRRAAPASVQLPQTRVPQTGQGPQRAQTAITQAEAKWLAERADMFRQLIERAHQHLDSIARQVQIGTLAHLDSVEPEQTLEELTRAAAADGPRSGTPADSEIATVKERFAAAMRDLDTVETRFTVGLANTKVLDAALLAAAAVLQGPASMLPGPAWDAPMSDPALIAALKSAPTIAGDANRADALLALARHNPFSPEMVALYVAAANSITSDAERARVFAQPIRVKPTVETPIAAAQGPSGSGRIVVAAGRSLVLTMTFEIKKISITDPDVADAMGVSPRELRIDGKSPGTTRLNVWGDATRAQYDVEVHPGLRTLRPRVVEHDQGARQKPPR